MDQSSPDSNDEFEGRIVNLEFDTPLFKNVEHTYVLACRREESITETLLRVKPTRYVHIFVSLHWKDKKRRPRNCLDDIHLSHAAMYSHASNIDGYILVMEDDASFWTTMDSEIRAIDKFLVEHKPDVYLLGHAVNSWVERKGVHFRTNAASGSHCQFYSRRVRNEWMSKGLKHANGHLGPETQIDCGATNPCSPNNGLHNDTWMYMRPIGTQIFESTENRTIWLPSFTQIDTLGFWVSGVSFTHAGWIPIYLLHIVTYLIGSSLPGM